MYLKYVSIYTLYTLIFGIILSISPFPYGARSRLALKKRGVAPLPTPYSLLPIPYSLLPTPYSLLPTPYSLFFKTRFPTGQYVTKCWGWVPDQILPGHNPP